MVLVTSARTSCNVSGGWGAADLAEGAEVDAAVVEGWVGAVGCSGLAGFALASDLSFLGLGLGFRGLVHSALVWAVAPQLKHLPS